MSSYNPWNWGGGTPQEFWTDQWYGPHGPSSWITDPSQRGPSGPFPPDFWDIIGPWIGGAMGGRGGGGGGTDNPQIPGDTPPDPNAPPPDQPPLEPHDPNWPGTPPFQDPNNYGGWDPMSQFDWLRLLGGGLGNFTGKSETSPGDWESGDRLKDLVWNFMQEQLRATPGSLTPWPGMQMALGDLFGQNIPSAEDFRNYFSGVGGYPSTNNVSNMINDMMFGGGGLAMGGQPMRTPFTDPYFEALAAGQGGPAAIQQQALGMIGQGGAANNPYSSLVGQLLGGSGQQGNLGAMDWLSSIYQQGFPNQRAFEGMMGQNFGQANQLMNNPLGGGYNYVDAMNQVFGPQGIANTLGNPATGSTGMVDITQNAMQGFNQMMGPAMNWMQQAAGMAGGVSPVGTPGIQGEVENRLMERMGQGGLTPEYVQAMQNQVLVPAQEQLVGRLNEMSGGRANLGTSGLAQGRMTDLTADFTDSMNRIGFENYMQALNQAQGLGGQQFGQGMANQQLGLQGAGVLGNLGATGGGLANQFFGSALGGYNAVPNQAFNAVGLAHDINMGLQGMGNQQFGMLPQLALPYIQTGLGNALNWQELGGQQGLQDVQRLQALQNLFYQPAQYGQDAMSSQLSNILGFMGPGMERERFGYGMMNDQLRNAMQFLGQQQGFGLDLAGIQGNILQSLIGGDVQRDLANRTGRNEFISALAEMLANMNWSGG